MSDKDIGIAANFLFTIFSTNEYHPEAAAEKTELVIRQAVELLYPKENNHIDLREDWIIKYCAFLRDSLDEMTTDTKLSRDTRLSK